MKYEKKEKERENECERNVTSEYSSNNINNNKHRTGF